MRTILPYLAVCALLLAALIVRRPYPGSIAVTREGREIVLRWADSGEIVAEYEPGDSQYRELDLALRGELDGRK